MKNPSEHGIIKHRSELISRSPRSTKAKKPLGRQRENYPFERKEVVFRGVYYSEVVFIYKSFGRLLLVGSIIDR